MGGCNHEMRLTVVSTTPPALVERCIHCGRYHPLFPGWSKTYLKQESKETR